MNLQSDDNLLIRFFSQPRQNGRYSRVPSQGGGSGTHNVFSPEYDDPANCAPEEDQYGSQYGQYGAPYDHYGSRGSVGRRSVGSARNIPVSGSPEPPPPPPRNHDQNNSSFNDSKESNEISEAECDRDQLVNRNYGGQYKEPWSTREPGRERIAKRVSRCNGWVVGENDPSNKLPSSRVDATVVSSVSLWVSYRCSPFTQ